MINDKSSIAVILDDDPTGTQTVYDVTVLTGFSVGMLEKQLNTGEKAFFILTNTRAFPPEQAASLIAEICTNIKKAAAVTGDKITIILRGDSTLRGHFPLEAESVESVFGKADKWIICPFFFEGNRVTKKDIHYLVENGRHIPVAETVFAKDASFGYVSSDLKEWIIEKSKGRFSLEDIISIDGELIDEHGEAYVRKQLTSKEKIAVISAETMRQVSIAANTCKKSEAGNNTFIYCTAASFVQAYLRKEKREPLGAASLITKGKGKNNGGLIIVGSYVSKTTQQLEQLLLLPGLAKIEINVREILDKKITVASIAETVNTTIAKGITVVLFTSRKLVTADNIIDNLSLGQQVSDTLTAIVQALSIAPSYCIAKGGITSSDIATKGLGIKKAAILGQALPGVPVWLTGAESKFPGLKYIIFAGNVGDVQALQNLVNDLEKIKAKPVKNLN